MVHNVSSKDVSGTQAMGARLPGQTQSLPKQAVAPTPAPTTKEDLPLGFVPKQSKDTGHYHVVIGAVIADRYTIMNLLGEGTFAKVVECMDRVENRIVAVKMVRSVREYIEDAKFEIDMLNTVRRHDPEDRRPCVKLLRYFSWNNHMCLVFDKKGPSLLDFMQKNRTPFVPEDSAAIARQMCRVLEFLKNNCNLVHTDLKPENILLEEPGVAWNHKLNRKVPKSNRIRVVDFGGATKGGQHEHSIISTRHYRAPEVVLCTGWAHSADMWSLGCILAELHTGKLLFDTHDNREHLAMMEKTLGPIPKTMFKSIYRDPERLVVNNSIVYPKNWETSKGNMKARRFQDWIQEPLLLDLLRRMLHYDKTQRITPAEALKHPFLTARTSVPYPISSTSGPATITAPGCSTHQTDKEASSTSLQDILKTAKATPPATPQRTLSVLNMIPQTEKKDRTLKPSLPLDKQEIENIGVASRRFYHDQDSSALARRSSAPNMALMPPAFGGASQAAALSIAGTMDRLRTTPTPAQPRSYHHGPFHMLPQGNEIKA